MAEVANEGVSRVISASWFVLPTSQIRSMAQSIVGSQLPYSVHLRCRVSSNDFEHSALRSMQTSRRPGKIYQQKRNRFLNYCTYAWSLPSHYRSLFRCTTIVQELLWVLNQQVHLKGAIPRLTEIRASMLFDQSIAFIEQLIFIVHARGQ